MATKTENSVSVNEVSRIAAGTLFKGEIQSPGDIRIDGNFDGKLTSKGRVVIGEKASLTGDVICQNMDFCGAMKGNFFVKDTLTLKAGCSVEGDLHVKRIQVELGARFNGNCKMIDDAGFDKLTGTPAGAGQPVQE